MRLIRGLLAALFLASCVLLTGTASASAAVDGPRECVPGGVPIDSIDVDPCPEPKPPQPGAPGGDEDSGEDSGKDDDEAGAGGNSKDDEYVKYGTEDDPETAPDQWGIASGQGAQGLADYARDRIEKRMFEHWSFSAGWLGLYSIMLALGIVLAVAAIMIASARLASNTVEGRTVFQKGALRLFLLSPIYVALPWLIAFSSNTGWGLAKGFWRMGWQEVQGQLDSIVALFGVGSAATWILPGGPAVVIAVAGMIMAAVLGILVELAAAEFLQYILALVLPIVIGASVYPKWAAGLRRVVAALVGAMLAPAAMAFIFTVVWSTVVPSDVDKLWRVIIFVVGVFVSLIAPYAATLLLQHILASFNSWRGVGSEAAFANAVVSGARQAKQSSAGFQHRINAQMDRLKSAQQMTDASAVEAGSEGATAAQGGAGARALAGGGAGRAAAAAGPVGVAVLAAAATQQRVQRGVNAIRSRVQGAFTSQGAQAEATSGGESGREQDTARGGSGGTVVSEPAAAQQPVTAGNADGSSSSTTIANRPGSEQQSGSNEVASDGADQAGDDAQVRPIDQPGRDVGDSDWTDDEQHAASTEPDDAGDSNAAELDYEPSAGRGDVRDADAVSVTPDRSIETTAADGPAREGRDERVDHPGPEWVDTGSRYHRQAPDVAPNTSPITRNTGNSSNTGAANSSPSGNRGNARPRVNPDPGDTTRGRNWWTDPENGPAGHGSGGRR